MLALFIFFGMREVIEDYLQKSILLLKSTVTCYGMIMKIT